MGTFGQDGARTVWARRVRGRLGVVLFLLPLLTAGVGPAGTRVEVTFDDEDDGSGPHDGHAMVDNLQNNFASLGEGYLAVELTGSARRSSFPEGWYGRGRISPTARGLCGSTTGTWAIGR